MSKELDEYLKELFKKEETDLHPVYAKILRNEKLCVYDQIIIKQALTPPTEQEVCEALGEYLERKVTYNASYQSFNDLIDGKWMRIATLTRGKVSITLYLPPHLITLISRFYEKESERE